MSQSIQALCSATESTPQRLCLNRFHAGVECGNPHFFERLRPPIWHQPPSRLYKVSLAVVLDYRIHGIGGAHIETRPHVMRRPVHRKPIQPDDLLPSQLVCKASAHAFSATTRRCRSLPSYPSAPGPEAHRCLLRDDFSYSKKANVQSLKCIWPASSDGGGTSRGSTNGTGSMNSTPRSLKA
jgi:hypothetical protein